MSVTNHRHAISHRSIAIAPLGLFLLIDYGEAFAPRQLERSGIQLGLALIQGGFLGCDFLIVSCRALG